MENLRTMSVPDFSAYRNDPTSILLAKRCEEATSLGMFRIQDNEFLLCYDGAVFFVFSVSLFERFVLTPCPTACRFRVSCR